jgi:hypothetical protein
MTDGPRPDGGDVLARVGHHWGWLMAFGVITFPGPAPVALRRHQRRPGRTFKSIDAEVRAVHTVGWERAFGLFRLLI